MGSKLRVSWSMRSSKFRDRAFALLAIAAVATPNSSLRAEVQASPAQESQAAVEGPRGAHRSAGTRKPKAIPSKHRSEKAKALPLEVLDSPAAVPAREEQKPRSGWDGAYVGVSGGGAGATDGGGPKSR